MVLERPAPVESNPLRQRDVPLPEPGDAGVRVRVRVCGVYRTDVHVVENEPPPRRPTLIPGHQVVGVGDAVGPRCSGWKPASARHRLAALDLRRLRALSARR
jgi:alcohol dehydrogenase, propanol-preferring